MIKKLLFSLIAAIVSITLLVALSEIAVRLAGFQPWEERTGYTNEPTMHEPDPVTGWRNKAGSYVYPGYVPSANDIHVTFNANRQRATGKPDVYSGDELVIVGGSYTQGLAISDHETYPWKLQKKFPSLQVLNYGTGGYGTFQSLLILEHELAHLNSPSIVLYSYIPHHEVRNVAPAAWMSTLSMHSRRGHVDLPYATLDTNRSIVRHTPERYLELPFRKQLAVVAFLEREYMRFITSHRMSQRGHVTQALMLEMDALAKEHGAKFAVVLLVADQGGKKHYKKYLGEHGIEVIDCASPLTPAMRVPGETHPNGLKNSLWANCIAGEIEKLGWEMQQYQIRDNG